MLQSKSWNVRTTLSVVLKNNKSCKMRGPLWGNIGVGIFNTNKQMKKYNNSKHLNKNKELQLTFT